jgi:acyl-coenzyme A thioesterase PaaI-like protein
VPEALSTFDAATAVEPVGDGVFSTQLDPEWQVAGHLNGGYLFAVATRAALQVAGAAHPHPAGAAHPHPIAASALFASVPEPGPAEVRVSVLRWGRNTVQTQASLYSNSTLCVQTLVLCGTVEGDVWSDSVAAPDLPREADCFRLPTTGPGFEVPMMGVVTERLDPATLGWVSGRPSGQGEIRGWVRFEDGRPADPLSLLMIIDCLPPSTFELGIMGWAPTLELTCHVLGDPAEGPLMLRQRTRHVAGGRANQVCDIWDSTGRLVATGQQLNGVRTPG